MIFHVDRTLTVYLVLLGPHTSSKRWVILSFIPILQIRTIVC